MTEPKKFIQTIYLGDRSCRGILIQSWDRRIEIQVDCISRIRSPSGNWEYYSDEDIPDGKIVFSGVDSIQFDPPGPVPNDAIDHFEVLGRRQNGQYEFEFAAEAICADGGSIIVKVIVVASSVHLENPMNPGLAIRT